MRDDRVLYRELSYRVMEAVFEVHNSLGPGFREVVYEQALAHELRLRKIPFEQQRTITVCYKDKPVGTHRLDLVVDGGLCLS